jgi:hypothetical protein
MKKEHKEKLAGLIMMSPAIVTVILAIVLIPIPIFVIVSFIIGIFALTFMSTLFGIGWKLLFNKREQK